MSLVQDRLQVSRLAEELFPPVGQVVRRSTTIGAGEKIRAHNRTTPPELFGLIPAQVHPQVVLLRNPEVNQLGEVDQEHPVGITIVAITITAVTDQTTVEAASAKAVEILVEAVAVHEVAVAVLPAVEVLVVEEEAGTKKLIDFV